MCVQSLEELYPLLLYTSLQREHTILHLLKKIECKEFGWQKILLLDLESDVR